MGTSWQNSSNSRRVGILVGYNLPYALWTGYALFAMALRTSFWTCPVQWMLGSCPGCGLTRAYGQFLLTGRLHDWWLGCILGIFLCNAAASAIKAYRCD